MPALYKDYDGCLSQLGSIYRTICLAHLLMIVSTALCKNLSLRASRSLSAGLLGMVSFPCDKGCTCCIVRLCES